VREIRAKVSFIAPAKAGATQIAVQQTPVKKTKWHWAESLPDISLQAAKISGLA
jgi:hypothetical protein